MGLADLCFNSTKVNQCSMVWKHEMFLALSSSQTVSLSTQHGCTVLCCNKGLYSSFVVFFLEKKCSSCAIVNPYVISRCHGSCFRTANALSLTGLDHTTKSISMTALRLSGVICWSLAPSYVDSKWPSPPLLQKRDKIHAMKNKTDNITNMNLYLLL